MLHSISFSTDMRFGIAVFILLALIVIIPILARRYAGRWLQERPMIPYVFRRITAALFTLFLVITVVFLLLRLFPEEIYIDYSLINKAPEGVQDALIKQTLSYYGLDQPILKQLYDFYVQIFPFPKDLCHFSITDTVTIDAYGKTIQPFTQYCAKLRRNIWVNLGVSATDGTSIAKTIRERAPYSFIIAFPTAFLSMLIGYPFGVLMAKNKGKWVDQIGITYEAATLAIPGIVLFGLFRTIFLRLQIPVSFIDGDYVTYLPAILTGALVGFSAEAYYIRRYIVDQMSGDYVKFARACGLSENRIMFTHVFRNALVYIIRYIPATIIFSFAGGYFIERFFSVPGLGSKLIDALRGTRPDIFLVQSLVIFYALLSLTSNLLADLVVVWIDPRISIIKNK